MRFSRFSFPLFAVGYAVAVVVATATYSVDSRAAGISLSVTGCDSFTLSGTPPNQVLSCVTTSSGVGTCTINATTTPSPLTSATATVALSASCSTTFASYAWVRNGQTLSSTSSTASDTLSPNTGTSQVSYTYQLTACNGATCAPTTSVTLFQPAAGGTTTPPPTPPPTGSWPVSCSGFTKTLNVDLPWATTDATTRVLTSSYGGFGSNDAVVVRLSPPAGVASYGFGGISGAEWGGGPVQRLSHISTTPCDFSTATEFTLYDAETGTSDVSYSLEVGSTQQSWIMLLAPGVQYYLNIKNTGCRSGYQCNMFLDFIKPPGT